MRIDPEITRPVASPRPTARAGRTRGALALARTAALFGAIVFTAAGCGSSSAPPTVTVNVVNHDAASAFLQGCSSCGSTSVGLQSGWGAGFPEKKLPVAYKIVVQGVASVCPQTTTVAGKNGPEIDYAVNAAGNCVVEANTANG